MRRIAFIGLCFALIASIASADSLFSRRTASEGTLISNKKPKFQVGDLITVEVRENIDATTEANTNTKKESTVESDAPAAANPFLVAPGPGGLNIISKDELPNWGIDMGNEHKSTGRTRRANKLLTTISCTVTQVFDNGNLGIEGTKTVTVNREDSKLFVKGIVRARDVTPGNTVLSSQVANAEIELKGAGPLWNNQRRGLLTKLLDWFSPF